MLFVVAAPPAEPVVALVASGLADAVVVSTAVFFATMAAAPSHIVILHANRAGTINRPQARGNGARRRFAPPRTGGKTNLHRLCPAPAPVNPPDGRRPESAGARMAIRVTDALRGRAAVNRSAALPRAPYTGRSERRGRDE
ncbi:hypothetical protein GCM10010326_45670 [Streptomyces xanthochromogenes]|uniref:Uncharacterized protein n=1 Tax=Streptomyces xanthochromogenes TaxID=67384 RepID=A0ABQ3AFA2_9ACTN|nr:hypothetical protein GCM10010326_45670 [Streptomyces xanthochromogenes]